MKNTFSTTKIDEFTNMTPKKFQKKWEKSKIRKREKFKLEKKFLFCSYSETRLGYMTYEDKILR